MTQPQNPKVRKMIILMALAVVGIVSLLRWRAQSGISVSSEPIRKGAIFETVYGIGTVMADKSYQLKSGVTSTVGHVYVKEGDDVKAAQRLVSLEDSVTFNAPFAGTVTALPIKEGETVFAQTVLLNLVDLKRRYIVVSLEQRAAVRVKRGQKARLSFENLRDAAYEGQVTSVYSNEGNFLVRIDLAALPEQILPGMTADVAIIIFEKPDVLLVPVAGIHDGSVRIQRNNHRSRIPIKVGLVDGAVAEVVSGDLQEGDRVLTGLPR